MSGQGLLRRAHASGAFPTMSARRLRNVVIEAFTPRYLIDDGLPARILGRLKGRVQTTELRQLMYLYTCRANPILADFVRDVYWQSYTAGNQLLTKEETSTFVRRGISRGKTGTNWAPSTVIRMSNYLLGTCADYGLLGPIRQAGRTIIPFRIAAMVSSILIHDLHFRGIGDNAIKHHGDWALFGLEPDDVMEELKRGALRGEIIVQTAGGIVCIGWKQKSLEDWVNGLAEC